MKYLVTGGAGYIGSHTVVELYDAGHEAVIVDNLSNSKFEAVKRIEQITGKKIPFYKVDLRSPRKLAEVFKQHKFGGVIHFAGLKAVGESVAKPLEYYDNSLIGTIKLLEAMRKFGPKSLVFSSSATVYGDPEALPLYESAEVPARATNPYGQTKLFIELILEDLAEADSEWQIINLRYFNPVGAHKSGLIGEDPQGLPNNLMPFISQVTVGRLKQLQVFGDDYDTPDGTGVRDYIHVADLARGHVAAVEHMPKSGIKTYNLGTGRGVSVLEMIKAFEKASKKPIPYKIVGRRPGDIAACYADVELAHRELGWKAKLSLDQMCADAWNWQSNNPRGYGS